MTSDRDDAASTPLAFPAVPGFARWLRAWAERWTARTALVVGTAAGIYTGLRLLAAIFGNPEPPMLTLLGWGSGENPYAAAGLAVLICIAMLALYHTVAWWQLSHQVLGPTRQLLRATVASHRTPITAFALRYVGVIMTVFGAAVSVDMSTAITNGGSGLLPVNGFWRWPMLLAGLVAGGAGVIAIWRSNPFLGKSNRRALRDPRPPVLLLGALDFDPLQEVVNLGGSSGAWYQSRMSQLVQLLWLIGPVVTPDMSGRRRDAQGAAIVPTTRATHEHVIETMAASARLIVVVLGCIGRLRHEILTAATTGDAPLVILVPPRNRYRRLRRIASGLHLPPLIPPPDQKLSHGIFHWAILGSAGNWKLQRLTARAEVNGLGVWLNKQLAGFSGVLPARVRWVGPRAAFAVFKIAGLGLLILAVAINAWQAVHG